MKKLMIFIAAIMCSIGVSAQSREYIRKMIREYGECKNVAITKYNGDLMLYGNNGWAATGCPKGLTDAIKELHAENETIVDVQLTDNGSWLILYGSNGFVWNDIPYSLEQKIRAWHEDNQTITSVTFNDDGDWIIVSKEYVSSSDSDIQDWVVAGMDNYGPVWATCITDDAAVVVYERGFRFLGEVPNDLQESLREADFNVYRVKIAGSAWFFSDGKRRYHYNM